MRSDSTARQNRFLLLTGLILIAAAGRLVNAGLINFQPIGAMALFGGACFASRRAAFLVPMAALLISDVGLNLTRHSFQASEAWQTTLLVYPAFALVVGIGFWLKRSNRTIGRVALGSLASSVAFFLVSNLAAWVLWYEPNLTGLADCYWQGLAFVRGQSALANTVLGDLCFNAALFGSLALVESRVPSIRPSGSVA